MLGAAVEEAGWRSAVLSSPHVECVTERVRFNREPISAAALADALEMALQARAAAEARGSTGAAASWFDTFVAGSLLACAEARMDWAVVECGLGGRCDSTNVLGAPVALLTSVELEHTEVLGSTLEAIAREKGAIASPGGALLACVPASLSPVVRAIARDRRARTCTVLPRSGSVSSDNLELARLALDELGRRGASCSASSGTPGARISRRLLSAPQVQRARGALPGRTERLVSACGVRVLLDAAHTPASARALVASARLDAAAAGARPVLLIGMLDDKDHLAVASELSSLSPLHVVCVSLGQSQAGTLRLRQAVAAACTGSVSVAPDAASAVEAALAATRRCDTWLVVAGSFRLCGAVRPLLRPETWAQGDLGRGDAQPRHRGEQVCTGIAADQGSLREAVADSPCGSDGDMQARTTR